MRRDVFRARKAIDIAKKLEGRLIARKAENGGGRTSFADVDALPMHRRQLLSLSRRRNYTASPTEADRSPTERRLFCLIESSYPISRVTGGTRTTTYTRRNAPGRTRDPETAARETPRHAQEFSPKGLSTGYSAASIDARYESTADIGTLIEKWRWRRTRRFSSLAGGEMSVLLRRSSSRDHYFREDTSKVSARASERASALALVRFTSEQLRVDNSPWR